MRQIVRSRLNILFCIIIFITHVGLGQPNQIRFKRLTINDGLSLSSVYSIHQDSKGFMWFGTEDGLNKYDGTNFLIYQPDVKKENSLVSKWTELIYEDSQEHLWFGSKEGLTHFDPKKERFTRYSKRNTAHQLTADTITSLMENHASLLWVGTLSGINAIDLRTGSVVRKELEGLQIHCIVPLKNGELWVGTDKGVYLQASENTLFRKISFDEQGFDPEVRSIATDREGNLWLAGDHYLYRLIRDRDDPAFERISFSDDHFFPKRIEKLVIESNHQIWVSADDGLYLFTPENEKIKQIIKALDTSHSLAVNSGKSLMMDSEGNLWYGTFGDGVYRIDPMSGKVVNYLHNPANVQSISENAINCMYEDRSGKIWFGTFGAGINTYNPHAHKFGFLSHNPLDQNSLSSNFIWSIWECSKGMIWVGTNDAGLNAYDQKTNTYTFFRHNPKDHRSLSNSSVRKVFQDSKDRLWIGTDGGGLNRFLPESGTFIHYQHDPQDKTSISDNSVRVIYEDRESRLWVGTRSGLNLFDPEKGSFKRFVHTPEDPNSISNNFVYSVIFHDKRGFLWVGTYGGGLNRMDISTGQFKHYMFHPDKDKSISDNIVFSLYEDENDYLWVGTNNGLNRFNPATEEFEFFGIQHGLPNEVIYGIIPDASQNLWLTTNKGICRFNLNSLECKNFTVHDGLQSNEFNGGAFHKGQSGLLYAGGVYGMNIIDPSINYNGNNPAQVVITKLEVLGKSVHTFNDSTHKIADERLLIHQDDRFYIANNISYSDELNLDYQHRFFSIEFAALNTTGIDNTHYFYQMKGLDDDWQPVGNRNFISYANMNPGKYSFVVRAESEEGKPGFSADELNFVINPPFWATGWFYLIEVLLALVLIGFIYRYLLKVKTNRLLTMKNEKINQANQKLSASENNLKLLNETKDKFFSIVAHDLKNPFTSLLSISSLMAKDYSELDEEDKEQGIKRIDDSARRIYRLLENLLTWSRAHTGRLKYVPVTFNLETIIKDNVMLHVHQAKNKGVLLTYSLPDQVPKAYGDREMINAVARNLISNAIKFTPEGKTVSVGVQQYDGMWKVEVADQGVGINPENQQKLFNIGTKFKNDGTNGEKGTGLGLILCKEFVEKNGGRVSVSSEVGVGSNFSFTVPMAHQEVTEHND